MPNFYITGYRSYELGIFGEKDPKIKYLKRFIHNGLIDCVESGIDWFIFAGNLGVEYYAFEEALNLKSDYPELKLGVLFPFSNFGESWGEQNQYKKQRYQTEADFVDYYSRKPYEAPWQLQQHTQFLLRHTQGTWMIYDKEHPGKTQYFLNEAEKYAEQIAYDIKRYTLDDIQDSLYND